MKNFIIIVLSILNFQVSAHDTRSADFAAIDIITHSLSTVSKFNKVNEKATIEDVRSIVQKDFIPFIDIKVSAQYALKQYWDKLNQQQKIALENYMAKTLINNYMGFLVGYKDFDNLIITANPQIKQKNNKAIVAINIKQKDTNKAVNITLKIVNRETWKIYDVVFSGVSLIKNYQEQFSSYIKRKGFDEFTKKYLTK